MEVKIRILIKFRIFKRDITRTDETYRIALGAGLTFERIHEPLPANAHTLFDKFGAKVSVWQ